MFQRDQLSTATVVRHHTAAVGACRPPGGGRGSGGLQPSPRFVCPPGHSARYAQLAPRTLRGSRARMHDFSTLQLVLWTLPLRLCSPQLISVQDGIYALGKAHMCSTPFSEVFPNVAFETVPMFVCLKMTLSRPFKEGRLELPLSTPLSSRRSTV